MSNAQAQMLPQGEIDRFFSDLGKGALTVDAVRDYITAHKWLVNHHDPNTNATPVVVAAKEGSLGIVKLLHESGADLYAADNGDQGALFYAAHKGWRDVAEYLVGQGMDPTAPNKGGVSPAAIARASDFPSFGNELERWGAELKQRLLEEEQARKRAEREAFDANLRDVTKTMRGGLDKSVPAPKTARFGTQKS